MPKEKTPCAKCGENAAYVRTQMHDLEDPGREEHVGAVPLVKGGDMHIYRCTKCGHLTRVAVPD